jgi:hypothetical protein
MAITPSLGIFAVHITIACRLVSTFSLLAPLYPASPSAGSSWLLETPNFRVGMCRIKI